MKQIEITPDSIFLRNDSDFLFTEVDDETVLMNVNDNGYIGLNAVATDIWKLLNEQKSLRTIVADLTRIYDVDAAQCEQDLNPVLRGMVRRKILQLV